jgi:hypothetical protein
MSLSREEIFRANRKSELVDMPEWGGSVRIAEMSIGDTNALRDSDDSHSYAARLLQRALVDDDLKPLFSSDDLDRLEELPTSAIKRLLAAITKLNAFGKERAADLEKNSEPSPPDASSLN